MPIDRVKVPWVFNRLTRRHRPGFHDLADRVIELAPAESCNEPPAIFPEGELDKVIKIAPEANWDQYQTMLGGGITDHAPTLAYEFSDVGVSGGHLYKGAARAVFGVPQKTGLRPPEGARWQQVAEGHLVCSKVICEFFGHFIWDGLATELLPPEGAHPISLAHAATGHQGGYRQIMGLPEPQILHYGRVGKLTLYSDFGHNQSRMARHRDLRARVRRFLGAKAPRDLRGVFLLRGTSGEARYLKNEAQLAERARARGFAVIDPMRVSAQEIVRQTLDARIVVGVDGSHLAHALYTMADRGAMLVLQPPERFSLIYKCFTDRAGMDYAFLVGTKEGDGFTIDGDAMERLLDRLEARPR